MATAVVDIDGTLVDTNYHHAIAWYRAFRAFGFVLPLWRIHRHIGMGGDQLVAALAGEGFDRSNGDEVRAAEKVLYTQLIGEVEPLAGARALIEDLKARRPLRRPRLLGQARGARALPRRCSTPARWSTRGPIPATWRRTKPAPDLVVAALEKADAKPKDAVMIGDSTWDCLAAKAAKVRSIGVLTGGFSPRGLLEAGASKVFDTGRGPAPRLGRHDPAGLNAARRGYSPLSRPAWEASG